MIHCDECCDDDGSTIENDNLILSGGVCKTHESRMMIEGVSSV